jgi:short-subunit dehydrogenase
MKKIIVTDASDGLGYKLSKQLSDKNYIVIGIYRILPKNIKNLIYIKTDLSKNKDIE